MQKMLCSIAAALLLSTLVYAQTTTTGTGPIKPKPPIVVHPLDCCGDDPPPCSPADAGCK